MDNNEGLWGKVFEDEVMILGNASVCKDLEFDQIILASSTGIEEMTKQLEKAGVSRSKIERSYVEVPVYARINFLKNYAKDLEIENISEYAVAEGGVLRGDFAKHIHHYFPENDFYLFDNFSGFDARDLQKEKEELPGISPGHLNISSEEIVLGVLGYTEKAIMKKGYFPETTKDLAEREYIFVNLDFDLYLPTYEGLKYFMPRLRKGCCILIHDYFNEGYPGIKRAVDEYEEINGKLVKIPIGDNYSIAIIK